MEQTVVVDLLGHAIVCIQEHPRIIQAPDVFPGAECQAECHYSICCLDMGGITVSTTHTFTKTSYLTLLLVTRGQEVCSFQDSYVCMPTLLVEVAIPPLTFQVSYGPHRL